MCAVLEQCHSLTPSLSTILEVRPSAQNTAWSHHIKFTVNFSQPNSERRNESRKVKESKHAVNPRAVRLTHTPSRADSGSQRTDGDLCPAVRSVIHPPTPPHPPRVSIYYKTNNRKLCWLCCENSNNPHPCVLFLPFCCWLDFMTSSSLVSPRSDVAWSGLTLAGAAGCCIRSHCDSGIVCLSSFFLI